MIIDKAILDSLTAAAKSSPRLRMNMDLRNSAEDCSQRMLNALEPGTVLPIHRHRGTSETVVCLRGHLRELFYDVGGAVTEVIDLTPGGVAVCASGAAGGGATGFCAALNIPAGQWHSVEVLESGTVILECKDGPYSPLAPEDIMER